MLLPALLHRHHVVSPIPLLPFPASHPPPASGPAALQLPWLFSSSSFIKVLPPPEKNHLGLLPGSSQPPCGSGSSSSRSCERRHQRTAPSTPTSSSPAPHTEQQPLTAATHSSHSQQPPPAITVSAWASIGLPWWGNGGGCLQTPRGTLSADAAAQNHQLVT